MSVDSEFAVTFSYTSRSVSSSRESLWKTTAQNLIILWYRCVKLVYVLWCLKMTLHFSLHPSGVSRQAWALVSVVGGGNTSCSEDVREHENHDTGGRALARRNFTTVDGVAFSVTAYSEWKNGEKWLLMESVSRRKVTEWGMRFTTCQLLYRSIIWTWKTFLCLCGWQCFCDRAIMINTRQM